MQPEPGTPRIRRRPSDGSPARVLATALLTALLATTVGGAAAQPPPPPTGATAARALQVRDWSLPVTAAHAAQPSLARDGEALLLSWIERHGEGHRLRVARSDADARFGDPHTIAAGSDWFVNWADFPALLALPSGRLLSMLLVKSAPLPYAYDLKLLQSGDGGASWSTPLTVHGDGTHTEHGFASWWLEADGSAGIAWLDGRATGGGGHGGHGASGAMQLRAARFDGVGGQEERQLDASTCDCCQTDAATAADAVVLVYRDRTPAEIRDIAIVRRTDSGWSRPALVHADGWKMPACPVNGPAVAAAGARVWVAWYTAADDRPRVQLARSDDSGARFAAPLVLAEGTQVLGRVDVQPFDGGAVVSWLEEDAGGQRLRLAQVDAAGQMVGTPVEVARLQGRGRATGFPRLQALDGAVHAVWTEVVDGAPQLRGAVLARPADAAR